jgi:mannose-6-phosphate isomerase-like protein (cupin superfamily)
MLRVGDTRNNFAPIPRQSISSPLGYFPRKLNQEAHMPILNPSTLENGNLKGADHGATISLILDHSEPGEGPRLHRHPYDETWVVQEGTLTFQYGDERQHARAGDIVIVPPGVPHKFTNDGPGRSSMVCIHANPTMVTEWLE